jgi:hypothetical protein
MEIFVSQSQIFFFFACLNLLWTDFNGSYFFISSRSECRRLASGLLPEFTSLRLYAQQGERDISTGCRPHPPSSTRGKAGRNHLNEEITPRLLTGIGERYYQTISKLGHAALLRRCELPLQMKVLN